jgi:hypothetical protein
VVDLVSGGFESTLVGSCNSGSGTAKVRFLEWLGGTMSLPTAKQTQILGKSSGGSGEVPMRFKVVRPRSGLR